MKKTFFKNLFRDIKHTLSRFLSIVIIIAMGVAFYAGVRATSPDMKTSADSYFNETEFMDFKLISTLGLTLDDVKQVEKLKDVKKVEGSYSIDAIVEKDKHELVINVNSIPYEDGINKMKIVSGRIAENNNEAVVEERFLSENKFKIGDEIELKSGKDTKIGDDLKISKFKIVGASLSPLYLSAQRQLSSIGNGSTRGFIHIKPEVFKNEVYTEIYVKLNKVESKDSLLLNSEYKNVTGDIEQKLKELGVIRNKVRYEQVVGEAQSKINTAEGKINLSKKEAGDKFAEGYKKLNDAKIKTQQGKVELARNQKIFNQKEAQGEIQIAEGKNQLTASQEKLNIGKVQAANSISSSMALKVADAKKQLDADPTNPIYVAQFNGINLIYEKNIQGKDFDTMYNSLKSNGVLDQVKPYFDIEILKTNFDKSQSQIDAGRDELIKQERLLQKAKKDLDAGSKKLDDAEKEIAANMKKIKAEEESANAKINDAVLEIQKNKDKIADIKSPEWYVLGRSANLGYETYRQDSDRIDNIGKAFPLIFFLVAALVSLTTMTRMVGENRIEIGTFKALGYSRGAIVSHYLIYALSASIAGSILGVSFGFRLFPPLIMNAYGSLYSIPNSLTPFNTGLAFQASLIAIFFTTIAAVAATLEELREAPASLMRPKPPKAGKTILLERVTFIWKRLSFTKKVTARNIFRYKQRLFMTVIGIATCTGLMITGFGLKSGIIGAVESQFTNIYRYDMQSTLKKNIEYNQKVITEKKIMEDTNVKSVLFTYTKNGTVDVDKSGREDAYVVVTDHKEKLNNYINLTKKGSALNLSEDGVIITEKLSKLMDKKIGDTFEITLNDKVVKAKITAITQHYVQHYIYMSADYYKKITGSNLEFNGFYGLLKSTTESSENSTSKLLTTIKDVGSISYKNNMHFDFNKTTKSINSVVLVLIVSAGVLAFVVIYNLTNININERKRELSTIKLLGFYNNELALYIYRENIILTVIGSLTGIAVGILLNSFVINTSETNVMMFMRHIDPIYFLYSVLITISFSIIVNLAMYREFGNIDMIESLKNAE
ncbi:FtsX-like permease family protein [Clostridium sp. CF012]|uniref:FtsX-like permease family protein n=1 Tax=Clostridium sp. CF012 TaxID=2843319 RepID=UPI001C0E68C9|nr:FtsX-like permease family protein [Clostridium sp. CF012]MBU3143272.1 FtsX-like permease family protein [Clostridium sp. CF012]